MVPLDAGTCGADDGGAVFGAWLEATGGEIGSVFVAGVRSISVAQGDWLEFKSERVCVSEGLTWKHDAD